MEIEIDQSGKVEDTGKITVVAFTNGKAKTLAMKATEKRKLIKIMLLQLFDKAGKKRPEINFAEIGRKSLAHKTAIEAFRKKKAAFEAKEEEVLALVLGI